MKGEVFPERNIMHRWMGPPDSCDRCHGRGWYPECDDDGYEIGERYCDCPCGEERKRIEAVTDRDDG